jgi:hypothetical protein
MAYSCWNQFGIRLQGEPHNLRARLLHFIRHNVLVDVERGLDVTVSHELLLPAIAARAVRTLANRGTVAGVPPF